MTKSAKYILALDQGTTSSRAMVFDEAARVVAVAQQEFEQLLPGPGLVEHDPEAIWSSQLDVARKALQAARLTAADIAGIGVTNQRETTILWDCDTGRPVHNAIVWQSRVTADMCERLKAEGLEPLFREKTGLVVDAYFSGTKIKYLLDTVPGLREQARAGRIAFGTVDTWLLWRLSGGRLHMTDYSNASRTLVYNIHTLDWDDELLALLDIPRAILPEVRPSSEVYGTAAPNLLGGPIPLAGCAGDQQAATFGQACFAPGMAKNTYGTGCFLLMNTGHSPVTSRNNLLTTIGWFTGDQVTYCLEGSVFIAGAAVQWLRDGLGLIERSSDIEQLAASVPDAAGVVFVPALVGLGAPYWDPYARGTIMGITRGTTAAHLARAAVEAMAYQTCDLVQAMEKDAGIPLRELRVDGGAAVNDSLLQFQADMLGRTVRRPACTETTALGAAYLAGLAVGYWDPSALSGVPTDDQRALEREFVPQMSADERKRKYHYWRKAVDRSLAWNEP